MKTTERGRQPLEPGNPKNFLKTRSSKTNSNNESKDSSKRPRESETSSDESALIKRIPTQSTTKLSSRKNKIKTHNFNKTKITNETKTITNNSRDSIESSSTHASSISVIAEDPPRTSTPHSITALNQSVTRSDADQSAIENDTSVVGHMTSEINENNISVDTENKKNPSTDNLTQAPVILCSNCKKCTAEKPPPPPRQIPDVILDAKSTTRQVIEFYQNTEISNKTKNEIKMLFDQFVEHFKEIEKIDRNNSTNKDKTQKPAPQSRSAHNPEQPKKKPTPSQVIKRTIQSAQDSEPKKNVVIIEMKEELKTAAQPKKEFSNMIKAKENNIQIKSLKVSGNKMIVVTNKPEQAEKIKNNAEIIKRSTTIRAPAKKLPRIVIYNVPSEIKKEDLVNDIIAQNDHIKINNFKDLIKPLFPIGKKNEHFTHWVVETQPELRNILIEKKNSKFFIGCNSCRIKDYTNQTRCFNCLGFGHVAKHCICQVEVCGHCAVKGHSIKICPNTETPKICANCVRRNAPADHPVSDKSCPSFLKYISNTISNFLYKPL